MKIGLYEYWISIDDYLMILLLMNLHIIYPFDDRFELIQTIDEFDKFINIHPFCCPLLTSQIYVLDKNSSITYTSLKIF